MIADDLAARYPVAGVRVRVAKPHAPVKHDVAEVAVTVERGLDRSTIAPIGGPEAPV